MKKVILGVVVLAAVAAAVIITISRADARDYPREYAYTNSEYMFTMDYPYKWKMKQEAGASMTSVCFAKWGCTPGRFNKSGPQINLKMYNLRAAPWQAKIDAYDAADLAGTRCELIEKGNRKWAKKKHAHYSTIRCPEKNRWRYTTTITMEDLRRTKRIDNMFVMECSMRSSTSNIAKSLAQYHQQLKPACENAIFTSNFIK